MSENKKSFNGSNFVWSDELVLDFAQAVLDKFGGEDKHKKLEEFKAAKQSFIGYEILECFNITNKKLRHLYVSKAKSEKEGRCGSCEEDGCEIFSVRRIKDNSVWTVGDFEEGRGKITGFKIIKHDDKSGWKEGLHILGDKEGYHCHLDFAVKAKEPIHQKQSEHENKKPMFEEALRLLINSYSLENDSNTPDYILSQYLSNCLSAYNKAVKSKDTFFERKH